MNKAKKYQVKVAKSTITKEGLPSYIDPDRWYNVVKMYYKEDEGMSPNKAGLFYVESTTGVGCDYITSMKESCHLRGANWRLRVVKDV